MSVVFLLLLLSYLIAATALSALKPSVKVYPSSKVLAKALCNDIKQKAKEEIDRKGSFYMAVPGGSVLKLLSALTESEDQLDWAKVHLFYVNHKCVSMEDPSATHLKAKDLFIDAKIGINSYMSSVDCLAGDGATAASYYETQLRSSGMQVDEKGIPAGGVDKRGATVMPTTKTETTVEETEF